MNCLNPFKPIEVFLKPRFDISTISLFTSICLILGLFQNGVAQIAKTGPQQTAFYHSDTTSAGEEPLAADLELPRLSPFGFLLTYFPSELIRNGIELKTYVRSRRLLELRKKFGDVRAVDAIYIRALRLTEGNTAMALLYSSIATMDHRLVGIKIPLLKLFFPLSNESDIEFNQRVAHLPSHLYTDTPQHFAGDRDKLQHFFGSAFITFAFESRGAAERVGDFIERGEDAFIVGGAYDERDMRANHQGQEFGLALLKAARQGETEALRPVLPSDFLTVQIATNREPLMSGSELPLCGAW